ncbi:MULTISPECIES: TRAP transporter substrate-binding protein [Aerosakkonema]|uniref:TRAP transporter substrate-binding protein n=1 Tax=Aerosakkonema TaxID=1246629 RepID=UPI0035B81846
MKRRKFFGKAAIAAFSKTIATTGTSSALPTIRWGMAISWPKSLETIYRGADTVCKRVRQMTNGRFTITPFAAGEIFPRLQVLDAVPAGTVECGHTPGYYYVGKNPALGFDTSVPFGFNAQQQNAWLYRGGGLEAMQKLYSDFNIINFPAGNTGVQMGGWFKREIKSLADLLKGLKMRIPGLGGEVMSRFGLRKEIYKWNATKELSFANFAIGSNSY